MTPTPEDKDARTLTIKEAARFLGIGRDSAYEAVRTGKIPSLRLSAKCVRIPREALERLLSEASAGRVDLAA